VLGQVISTALVRFPETGRLDIVDRAITVAFNLGVAALFASLIATRRWWVHAGVTVFVLGAVLYSLAFQIPPLS